MPVELPVVIAPFTAGTDYGIDPTQPGVTVLGSTYAMGADKTGIVESGAALNNALLAAYRAKTFVRLPAKSNFVTNSPLQLYRLTDVASTAAPSILGAGSGTDDFAGYAATSKITAGPAFPIGEFLIDYIGSTTTLFSPLAGFTIGHLALSCASRAAGIRLANIMDSTLADMQVLSAATPAPANNIGSPTGAVTLVKSGSLDYSYNNLLDHVFVSTAGRDCFHLDQTNSSSISAQQCIGIGGGRYSFWAGDNVELIDCDAQNSLIASYYLQSASLIGCHEYTFPSKGNSIIFDNPGGTGSPANRMAQVIGGLYTGTITAGTEAGAAMVHFLWANVRASLVGVNFIARSSTTDWVYVDAGAVTTAQVIFDACNFNTVNNAPVTQKYNLNGTTYVKFVNCPGLNPFGVQTPAVPATGVAVAATPYDRTFYVTTAALGATMAIQGGPAIAIPASGFGTVRVPAGQTVTPTFTNAPTWVVEGE